MSIFTVFLKNRNFNSKIRRSKVTDYAALNHFLVLDNIEKFWILLKILWKMEHLLFWSKCSIFHNIFKYMIFQRHQFKALIWSKGLKESKTCIPYCIKQNFSFVLYRKHQLNAKSLAHSKMSTLCLLVSSADNLWKQFGPRPGPTKPGSNLFDTQMLFQNFFFEKVDFEKKISRQQKSMSLTGVRDLLYGKCIWLILDCSDYVSRNMGQFLRDDE